MIRAGAHGGEYYEATHTNGDLVGFLVVMPAGHDLFGTYVENSFARSETGASGASNLPTREERRALGLTEFMNDLSPEGKEYYKTTVRRMFGLMALRELTGVAQYMVEFPAFVNACVGPNVRALLL